MRQHLEGLIGKKIRLNIQEIRQPELDAYLVARSIADQIVRRVAYRRAMKQAIFRTIQSGAKGIKVSCAGRLGNAEIARRQTSHQGQVPLHTLRADIDYGFTEAHTTLGRIGVKVWIYKGQVLPELPTLEAEAKPAEAAAVAAAGAIESPLKEKLAEKLALAAEPEAVAPAATEEKIVKPRAKKAVKPAEVKTAVPEAEKSVKAKAAVEKAIKAKAAEEKPAKAKAEEKPAKAKTAEAETAEEQPAPKRRKKAEAAPEAETKEAKPVAEAKKTKEPAKKKEKEA
jgi:small subunit ribosomal protein S3